MSDAANGFDEPDRADGIASGPRGDAPAFARTCAILDDITAKQHEVLELVAENRTSKEIAWQIGVSESAVNQRIEAVRSRAGFPPRAELARAYRHYVSERDNACEPLTGQNPQVRESAIDGQAETRNEPGQSLVLADALDFTVPAPWQAPRGPRVGPEVLDGPNAGMRRFVAMILLAGGMLAVAMVGLGVAQALSTVMS